MQHALETQARGKAGDDALEAAPVIMVTPESGKTRIMEAIQAGARRDQEIGPADHGYFFPPPVRKKYLRV